ncbi:hypothetical protein P7K49_022758 [Saguinus oedipus]|uniref:Hydroxyacylglutathione hydrolase-like protein n=1 Tax=Saguinus oedipus TaxID=9490 RepID=A0ABQ9UJP0_SAGOE|nr:hypothetical protein P7K49_022758 [Saguinus oedipus]
MRVGPVALLTQPVRRVLSRPAAWRAWARPPDARPTPHLLQGPRSRGAACGGRAARPAPEPPCLGTRRVIRPDGTARPGQASSPGGCAAQGTGRAEAPAGRCPWQFPHLAESCTGSAGGKMSPLLKKERGVDIRKGAGGEFERDRGHRKGVLAAFEGSSLRQCLVPLQGKLGAVLDLCPALLGVFHHTDLRKSLTVDEGTMKVEVLPALTDNYMYLIIDDETKEAAIVDPVQPQKLEGLGAVAGGSESARLSRKKLLSPALLEQGEPAGSGRATAAAPPVRPGFLWAAHCGGWRARPGNLMGLCPAPVLLQVVEEAKKHGVKLTTVLTTHHHW